MPLSHINSRHRQCITGISADVRRCFVDAPTSHGDGNAPFLENVRTQTGDVASLWIDRDCRWLSLRYLSGRRLTMSAPHHTRSRRRHCIRYHFTPLPPRNFPAARGQDIVGARAARQIAVDRGVIMLLSSYSGFLKRAVDRGELARAGRHVDGRVIERSFGSARILLCVDFGLRLPRRRS